MIAAGRNLRFSEHYANGHFPIRKWTLRQYQVKDYCWPIADVSTLHTQLTGRNQCGNIKAPPALFMPQSFGTLWLANRS